MSAMRTVRAPRRRNLSWYALRTEPGSGAPAGGPVDLQVAHHDVFPARTPQVDEGVGHKHADGIEHVGVVIAVRDHQ